MVRWVVGSILHGGSIRFPRVGERLMEKPVVENICSVRLLDVDCAWDIIYY